MKGYKVFNPDWSCRGFQYEVGETFEEEVAPVCCDRGFHFCTKLADCFSYYPFNPNNKVAEVEVLGDIDTEFNNSNSKCCTNKIRIIRELSWQEVLDIVNTGNGNTGLGNSGNKNSGHHNSGHYNSGSHNSGDCNTGNWNSGNQNCGNENSGHYNSGNKNGGYCNSGNWNSGNGNNGDYNNGNDNSGDCNTGHYNIGNYNTGDWNKTSFASGCFNTIEQKILLFNKPSDWTYRDWINSQANLILSNSPSSLCWVNKDDMSDEEKKQHPEYLVTEGYLKNAKPDTQAWWDNLYDEDKEIVKAIPNFDAEVFKEITGITV